jgi:transposase
MLDKILNLKDIIIEWCQHIEDIGIYFHVKGRNEKAICPRCGEVSDKIHQKYFQLNLILVNKLATKIFLDFSLSTLLFFPCWSDKIARRPT